MPSLDMNTKVNFNSFLVDCDTVNRKNTLQVRLNIQRLDIDVHANYNDGIHLKNIKFVKETT